MSDIVSQPKRLCTTTNRDDDDAEARSQSDPSVGTCGSTASVRLDDFCLLLCFNHLDISDLCNVSEVNRQFKRVSKMSFAARYATFHYPQHLKLYVPYTRESCASQIRRVLCKFGDSIKSMTLKDFDPAGIFIGVRVYPIESVAISKFCAGTMDELKLNLFFNLECDNWTRSLFSSLKTLTIHCDGFDGDAARLFSECDNLSTLRLSSLPYTDSVSEVAQKYPKLEELYIGNVLIWNTETAVALLQMNRQIRKLDMPDDHANKSIYAVASQMDGLEELVLRNLRPRDNHYDNVTQLASLKSLKRLEFHDVAPEFVTALQAMEHVPLDRFKWFDCPPDLQFTKWICELKTLKSLALTGISLPFDDCLRELGEQLPSLHELELGLKHQDDPLLSIDCLIKFVEQSTKLDTLVIRTIHSKLFDQQFYDQLVDVIESRRRRPSSSSETFKVTIYCYGPAMLQTHSNLVQVKFVECEYCSCSHCVNSVRSYEMYYESDEFAFSDPFDPSDDDIEILE